MGIAILIQIIAYKPRWNFILFYFTLFALVIILPWIILGKNNSMRFMGILPKIIYGILLLTTFLAIYAFPIPRLTKNNGPYKVGTALFDITDETRHEIYSDNPLNLRRFKTQIWYPAKEVENLKKSPWLINGKVVVKGLTKLGNLPKFILNQLSLTDSNSYLNAPMYENEGNYPVIILSHGWMSSRLLHTNMAEALASNGYIVIGIEHTYGSIVTIFEDGEACYFSNKTLPALTDKDFHKYSTTLVKTFSSDIEYVINNLNRLYNSFIKYGFETKIGLLGHSTGGGAGVLTSIHDKRVQALLAYDAWVEPIDEEDIQKGISIPALFIRSEEWEGGPNNKNLLSLIKSNDNSKLRQINGTRHSDFTLMYLFSPLVKKLNKLGKINGDELSKLQGNIAVEFFDSVLR